MSLPRSLNGQHSAELPSQWSPTQPNAIKKWIRVGFSLKYVIFLYHIVWSTTIKKNWGQMLSRVPPDFAGVLRTNLRPKVIVVHGLRSRRASSKKKLCRLKLKRSATTQKVGQLKRGVPTIYETGLEMLLQRNIKEKRLDFTTELRNAALTADVLFLAGIGPEIIKGVLASSIKTESTSSIIQ